MWEIKYSDEAVGYLYDNWPYVEAIFIAIESLRYTEDGLPPGGATPLELETFMREVEQHLIIYERNQVEKQLYVTVIKPVE